MGRCRSPPLSHSTPSVTPPPVVPPPSVTPPARSFRPPEPPQGEVASWPRGRLPAGRYSPSGAGLTTVHSYAGIAQIAAGGAVLLSARAPTEAVSSMWNTTASPTAAYLRTRTERRSPRPGSPTTAKRRTTPTSHVSTPGAYPALPSGRTKHPKGRPQLDPRTLEVVWFEEGDGVALLEAGQPLCVIPSWSDMDGGIPGYSREAIGRQPVRVRARRRDRGARSAHPAGAGLLGLAARRGCLGGLPAVAAGPPPGRLGPGGYYWHDVGRQSKSPLGRTETGPRPTAVPAPRNATPGATTPPASRAPLVGVSERPARGDRAYNVLTTVGMSCQRMPTVELYEDNVGDHARIELAVATTLPSVRAGSIFPVARAVSMAGRHVLRLRRQCEVVSRGADVPAGPGAGRAYSFSTTPIASTARTRPT